jgi:O-antigen ligase
MSGLYTWDIWDDPVTLVLLGALILLIVPPAIFITLRRVANPQFHASSFRWMYCAWILILAGSSVWNLTRDVRFSVEEAGADNYVRLVFLSLGALMVLAIGAKYRFAFLSELEAGVLGVFSLLALWGLSSTLWSISPAGTLAKSFEYCAQLGVLVLAASLIGSGSGNARARLLALKSVFDWNWFLLCLSMALVYAGILIWPEYAIMEGVGELGFSLQGALPAVSANGVGQLAAILGIVAIVRVQRPGAKKVFIPILVVSLITMVLAQSRSPILGFLLAVVVVLAVSRRFGSLLFASGLVGTALLSSYGLTIYEFLRRGQTDGTITTLSGRTTYWGESFQALQGNWLNGFGANVGGRHVLQTALGEEEVSTTHNMYVETLVDIGIVGLLLLITGIALTWFWLFKLRSYAMKDPISRLLWLECLGVFTILMVRSMFSVSFIWSQTVLTFGLILVFVAVMRKEVLQERHAGTPLAQPLSVARRRRSGIRR